MKIILNTYLKFLDQSLVLSTLNILIHLILKISLQDSSCYYDPHFTRKGTEAKSD